MAARKKIPNIQVDWEAVRKEMAPLIALDSEMQDRLEQVPSRHAELQAAALAQVSEWECYTFPAYELDPSYYLMGGYPSGRRLKDDPGPEAPVVRYGLDGNGRKRILRWPNEANIREWLWEYHQDRIDAIDVSTNKHSALLRSHRVQSVYFEGGKPVCFFECFQDSRFVRTFRFENDRIVEVFSCSAGVPRRQWVYSFADVHYETGNAHVREFSQGQDAGYAHVYRIPKRTVSKVKVPVLDLRTDVTGTVAALQKAVGNFVAKQARSDQSVSGIGLGYFAFENPEVFIEFDTRPEFRPDGEWSHPEFSRFKRVRWARFIESCENNEGKGVVIDAQGNRHEISEIQAEIRFIGWLGEALVVALKVARDSGVFQPLRKAPRCELCVEEAGDGEFGWPRYEDRGADNLVK